MHSRINCPRWVSVFIDMGSGFPAERNLLLLSSTFGYKTFPARQSWRAGVLGLNRALMHKNIKADY